MLSSSDCLKKLSFPSRFVRHIRGHKMLYIWCALIAAYAAMILYLRLPMVVFPAFLFITFLASGGRNFPKVFFRTILRDVRGIFLYSKVIYYTRRYKREKKTVPDIFQLTVSKYPQKAAIIFEQKTWTFQEVEDYSNRIANYFKALGYQKGDCVAVILESSPEFVCAWLGLSKLGVVTAQINTNLRFDSLWHCISVANVKAVIFGSNFSGAIKEIQTRIPSIVQLYSLGDSPTLPSATNLEKELENCSSVAPDVTHSKSIAVKQKCAIGRLLVTLSTPKNLSLKGVTAAPTFVELGDQTRTAVTVLQFPNGNGDKLLYIYTSGTTGLPKAAVITNARYFRMAYGITCALCVGTEDIVYSSLPLYHSSAGILGVGQCLINGCTLVLRRKFSASQFWDDCVKSKATIVQYIGEVCRYLLAQPYRPAEKQHSVRLAFGNGLRPQIWEEFQSRFGIKQIGEFYGSTEGTASVVNIDNKAGACGFVSEIAPAIYPVTIIKVDPDTGEIVRGADGLAVRTKPGDVGQIVGKSSKGDPSNRFEGYLNPVETSKKVAHDIFLKGDTAFLSGDLVVRDELGYIYFHDRTGDSFRWRGENVSTAEVEAIMSKVLGLCDVVVYGVLVPGCEGRAGMAAIVDPDNKVSLEGLATSLKKLLPSYACPMFLRIVHNVDITGTFKLQKNKLKSEGFDIGLMEDQLYYFDSREKLYMVLDEVKYEQIIRGEIRM